MLTNLFTTPYQLKTNICRERYEGVYCIKIKFFMIKYIYKSSFCIKTVHNYTKLTICVIEIASEIGILN